MRVVLLEIVVVGSVVLPFIFPMRQPSFLLPFQLLEDH